MDKRQTRRTSKEIKTGRISRKSGRVNRNLTRRIRRKRSKLRYYKTLRFIRNKRRDNDLCSSIVEIDINDMMEWLPTSSSNIDILKEVAEWQNIQQIAYWKSRAIALQMENKVLRQHLRDVYAAQIHTNGIENIETKETQSISSEENVVTFDEKTKPPNNVEYLQKRHEEMEKLYGDKAEKIMGMETAVQLNYELHTENGTVSHWPQIPLNIKFTA